MTLKSRVPIYPYTMNPYNGKGTLKPFRAHFVLKVDTETTTWSSSHLGMGSRTLHSSARHLQAFWEFCTGGYATFGVHGILGFRALRFGALGFTVGL